MDLFGPEALAHYLSQVEATPPQSSQKGSAGWGPYAAIFGSNLADLLSSIHDEHTKGTVEGNPANFDTQALVVNKVGSALISALLTKWLSDSGHPTAAKIAGYGSSVAPTIATIHNLRK